MMSAMPPITAITVVYGCAMDARPRMIKKNIAVSITMWPSETLSPAVQSPFKEALMVATSVGPGASAPVKPMRRPRTRVWRISVGKAAAPGVYTGLVSAGNEACRATPLFPCDTTGAVP